MSTATAKPLILNVGLGNYAMAGRIIAIVNPASAPMRRIREEAKEQGRIIDATLGRKTRAIIITDSNHVILSAIQAETLAQRMTHGLDSLPGQEEE